MSSNRQIMKLIKRIAKGVLILVLVLFTTLFIYANWSKPSLGERIYMENSTQIVVLSFPASFSAVDSTKLDTYFLSKEGVYSTVISLKSQTLCVTIDPRKTDRANIIASAARLNPQIIEREPLSSRAECPVNLNAFRKVTYALNVRK